MPCCVQLPPAEGAVQPGASAAKATAACRQPYLPGWRQCRAPPSATLRVGSRRTQVVESHIKEAEEEVRSAKWPVIVVSVVCLLLLAARSLVLLVLGWAPGSGSQVAAEVASGMNYGLLGALALWCYSWLGLGSAYVKLRVMLHFRAKQQ
ncbi:hypothetical protein ABPG75_003492 [Micractinium tetrahymenae]